MIIVFVSCQDGPGEMKNGKSTTEPRKQTFLDSLKSICKQNTTDTFDIENLQTDDFDEMVPIDKKRFQAMYPNRDDYAENSFFIYSYLPTMKKHMTLITYQKNYEGENYRVDYMDMVNIDSTGKQLDKIRMAAIDNEVGTYEVKSFLRKDTLNVIEQISSEPYFEPDLDTLYTSHFRFKINGKQRIDTLEVKRSFEVRRY